MPESVQLHQDRRLSAGILEIWRRKWYFENWIFDIFALEAYKGWFQGNFDLQTFKITLKIDFPKFVSDVFLETIKRFQTTFRVPDTAWNVPTTPRGTPRKIIFERKFDYFLEFSPIELFAP